MDYDGTILHRLFYRITNTYYGSLTITGKQEHTTIPSRVTLQSLLVQSEKNIGQRVQPGK